MKCTLVLKDYNRCQGRTQPEMFSPTPSALSLDDWYESELRENEVWKLNKALNGYRKAPKLWHQHVASLLASSNYHPLLSDPSCFRNDELNINIFSHVDDGLLFGPRVEVLRSVELLSNQIMMRIVGRMEKLGDKLFLGRVTERTARGYSVEVNPTCIRDVSWSGRLETSIESKCEEDTASRKQQERSRVLQSDEMNVQRIARYLKGVPSAKCSIEINRFPPFVNVYTANEIWDG